MMRFRTICLAAAGSAVLAGCASTRIQDVWASPEIGQERVGRLLIVGMMKEETARRTYETTLASQLRKRGINATESYRLVENGTALDRPRLEPIMREHGYDAVMIGRVTNVRQRTEYVPADPWTYGDFWGYYDHLWTQGYARTYPIVSVETRLYDTSDNGGKGKLIWSAVSESFDPASMTKMSEAVAKNVAKRITQDVAFVPGGPPVGWR